MLGLGQMTTAAAFYGSMGMWSVMMSDAFGAWSSGWVRATIVFVVMGVIGICTKQFRRIEKGDLLWFGLLAISGLVAIPYFFGFLLLGAGMGTVIFDIAMAIGGFLFARFLLKEKITLIKIISLTIALIGVVIVYGVSFGSDTLLGGLMMLLAGAVFQPLILVSNKKLLKYSKIQQVIANFVGIFVVCLPLSFVFHDTLPAFSDTNLLPWIAVTAFAGVNIGAMYFRICSLKHLNISVVVLVGLLEIVFGVLFGVLFLGESFTARIGVGIAVIIIGLALETTMLLIAKKRKT